MHRYLYLCSLLTRGVATPCSLSRCARGARALSSTPNRVLHLCSRERSRPARAVPVKPAARENARAPFKLYLCNRRLARTLAPRLSCICEAGGSRERSRSAQAAPVARAHDRCSRRLQSFFSKAADGNFTLDTHFPRSCLIWLGKGRGCLRYRSSLS